MYKKRAVGVQEGYSTHSCWLGDEVQAGRRGQGCRRDVAAAFLLPERNLCCSESAVLEP